MGAWGGETEKLDDLPTLAPAIETKVVVVDGPDEGSERALSSPVSVGTGADCDLALTDRSVSARHLTMHQAGRLVTVQDLGSSNGTFVDGTRVEKADVGIGALIQLGRTTLSIHVGYAVKRFAPSRAERFGELLGRSVAMREVFAMLERAAPTESSILIEGESGTGKELVARSVHAESLRASGPFVVLDCGAIPAQLVGAELFGYVTGAFTGATKPRPGVFEQADGGTLFLDEIGELPLDLQPNLLRALESRQVRRIGDTEWRDIDVRVLAATHRDLMAEVRRGAFRSDLFFRLNVMTVRIPPLRHRPDDIALLARHLVGDKLPPEDPIDGPNLATLCAYAWPGNVRELRNCLRRALALADPPVTFEGLEIDFGPLVTSSSSLGIELPGVGRHLPYKEAKAQLIDMFDRAYMDALRDRYDTITEAAVAAGLSRKHLYEIMRRIGEVDTG